MSITDIFKYIIPTSAALEKDPDTGDEFIYAKITNTFIREMKSADESYVYEWLLEQDSEGKYVRYNPNDANDVKELKISMQIRQEIHEVWKLLNPSGEINPLH